MKTNEFAKISMFVNELINDYRHVRKICGISDDAWHSRSIERIAAPFLKGYFTLAVVGKVSSGKSTFINALLGCKDLLPTGHDQTTCGITSIEYGETPEVTITFGDGHKTTIREDIGGKIRPYVAIPEKFHNLPINNIDEMIMGGFNYEQIWEAREQLESETLCSSIDEKLLKEYVQNRRDKDIAVEISMKYPFNEELKGWRVIDTPGIGAIGGIETRTRQLLAMQKEDRSREIDAIIFLQDGSKTLDQTDTKKFVKDTLDNLSESDAHRLFYVLTHCSSTQFLNHKETKIDFIKQNFGAKIKCLTYADGLLCLFLNDLSNSDVDLKSFMSFDKPDKWAKDEWDVIMSILFSASLYLRSNGDTINHDTMLRTIQDWAHFETLKSQINEFARTEKQNTILRLIELIAQDYNGFIKQFEFDKQLVDGDIHKIDSALKDIEKRRAYCNILAQKADKEIKLDSIAANFKFIDEELLKFENLDSIDAVRTAITNLFDSIQKKEKEVFEDIIKYFSDLFKINIPNNIVLESIDFEIIEDYAIRHSQESYVIKPSETIKHTSKPNKRIPALYGQRTNEVEKFRNFKTEVLRRARSERDLFMRQLKDKAENLRIEIYEELDSKLEAERKRCEKLKTQLSDKEHFKAENSLFVNKCSIAYRELFKKVKDYGCKM